MKTTTASETAKKSDAPMMTLGLMDHSSSSPMKILNPTPTFSASIPCASSDPLWNLSTTDHERNPVGI